MFHWFFPQVRSLRFSVHCEGALFLALAFARSVNNCISSSSDLVISLSFSRPPLYYILSAARVLFASLLFTPLSLSSLLLVCLWFVCSCLSVFSPQPERDWPSQALAISARLRPIMSLIALSTPLFGTLYTTCIDSRPNSSNLGRSSLSDADVSNAAGENRLHSILFCSDFRRINCIHYLKSQT